MKIAAAIVTAILSCAALPVSAESFRVVDGDTIVLDNQRIRLWGIDAPERSQTCEGHDGSTYMCGTGLTAVLVELTNNRTVTCVERGNDRYRRSVAVCSTEAGELNAAMVRRGWAVDYTQYSKGAYKTEEAAAKAEGLGIWSGRFTMPADYRHNGKRSDTGSILDGSNGSSYIPGMRHYGSHRSNYVPVMRYYGYHHRTSHKAHLAR